MSKMLTDIPKIDVKSDTHHHFILVLLQRTFIKSSNLSLLPELITLSKPEICSTHYCSRGGSCDAYNKMTSLY